MLVVGGNKRQQQRARNQQAKSHTIAARKRAPAIARAIRKLRVSHNGNNGISLSGEDEFLRGMKQGYNAIYADRAEWAVVAWLGDHGLKKPSLKKHKRADKSKMAWAERIISKRSSDHFRAADADDKSFTDQVFGLLFWVDIVRAYLAILSATRVTRVSRSVKKQLRETLSHVTDNPNFKNMSERKQAQVIQRRVKRFSIARAARIARTEVHVAANSATNEIASRHGMKKKVWASAQQARTRPTHAAANGQEVGMDEDFTVGGYPLKHPGDPSGPAKEVINCRCVVLFKN